MPKRISFPKYDRSPELACIDVYDGRERLGSVCERSNGQYEAAPDRGPSLGLFSSQAAAVQVVIAAAKAHAPDAH